MYELSISYYRLTGQRPKLARLLVNLALVHKNLGQNHLALIDLDRALRLLPERGYSRTRLLCHLNRGICLSRAGQLDNARNCFMQARDLAQRMNHRLVSIAVLNNLGHLFRMEGNLSTAREFYGEALRLAEKESIPRKVCLALEFLGETSFEEGRFTVALAHLNRARELAGRLANRGDLMMEVLRRRGEVLLALGERDAGKHELERAIALCQARVERRELVLARRAHTFAFASRERLPDNVMGVLEELQGLGDHFEYARTVCTILRDGRLQPAEYGWLSEAISSALGYVTSMGIAMQGQLQELVGHSPRIEPPVGDPPNPMPDREEVTSPLFDQALEAAQIAARSREPVLILGETGAGKEVLARLVHSWSARSRGPLVAINCGAIPDSLIEGELFGHVRGAFTGADRDRPGLLEEAAGGSVLLDEIGDLPLQTQVKLLRFLDSYELRRLGERVQRHVDVRILAATNRDLRQLVADGRFREDLFYRLNVFRVDVPPLRQRREEIPALVRRFLVEESQSTLPVRVAPDLLRWMQGYGWPGNVRELRNLCRYLSARAWGKPEIGIADLPPELQAASRAFLAGARLDPLEQERLEFEHARLLKALQRTSGNISHAAELLGMGRNHLTRKMREHGINRDQVRDPLRNNL
jgi:DNA-binding NtrC family response regulator